MYQPIINIIRFPRESIAQKFDPEHFMRFVYNPEMELLQRHIQDPVIHTLTEYNEELDKDITEEIEEIPLVQDRDEWDFRYEEIVRKIHEEIVDFCDERGLTFPSFYRFSNYVHSIST